MNNWSFFNLPYLSRQCVLCGDPADGTLFCPGCREDLRHPGTLCRRCALPLALPPGDEDGRLCGHCQARPPHYDAAHALFPYRWPLDRLITRMKFGGRLSLARDLGTLLGQRLGDTVEALVPVPAHPARRRERGYNQAEILARHAARAAGLPLWHRVVVRRRATPAQTALTAAARRRNLRGAFAVAEGKAGEIRGLHLAIVDDVMTTGSTVNELARVLRQAGADRVEVWVIARAPHPGRG